MKYCCKSYSMFKTASASNYCILLVKNIYKLHKTHRSSKLGKYRPAAWFSNDRKIDLIVCAS